jgi:hypothetical protein
MKRILLMFFVLTVGLALAAPATADLKFTSKGHMKVSGLAIKNHPVDTGSSESTNAWYNMEMIITPILHVNDKIRIHGQVRIMERNFSGTSAGDLYSSGANENKYRITGDDQNNFWWERLYLSFPLLGGTFYAGRMSGGNWGHSFGDDDQNRDRLKYVRKFGHIVGVAVIEKRDEADGGLNPPNPLTVTPDFTSSANDENGFALGAVVPFSKNVIFKPLLYWVHNEDNGLDVRGWFGDFTVNYAPVTFDAEIVYIEGEIDDLNLDIEQWMFYGDLAFKSGPAEIGGGIFGVTGTDEGDDDLGTLFGIGSVWEPLLLLTSEDMGFFWDTRGVPNGSIGLSGIVVYYIRGAYSLSNDIKVDGIAAYAELHEDGANPDGELGWEIDLGFEWKFLPNISYRAEAAYWAVGDYFETDPSTYLATQDTQDVYGFRHTVRITW